MPVICQKILHPNYKTYNECNFLHVYSFNILVCDILYELGLNYNQMSQTDTKGSKMRGKCQVYPKKKYYTQIMKFINAIFGLFTNVIYE